MDRYKNQYDEWFLHSESPNIKKDSVHNSRVSNLVNKAHTLGAFHLIAGFCQILLGAVVIVVSILGLIDPLWLSASLGIAASITTMIGLYLVYITVSRLQDHESLLRDAMKRVMESKN